MVNSIILWEYIFYDVYQTLVWRCSIRYKSLRFREEGSKIYLCVTDKQKVDKHNVSRWLHRIEAWTLSTSHIKIAKRRSIQWRRFGIYGQWQGGKTKRLRWPDMQEKRANQDREFGQCFLSLLFGRGIWAKQSMHCNEEVTGGLEKQSSWYSEDEVPIDWLKRRIWE